MKITYYPRPALLGWLVLVLALLVGGACVPQDMVVSPLGTVVVGAGEDIQIHSLEVLTGIGELGVPRQRAGAMAQADYGPIEGHRVSMGAGLDSLCTAEGGAENTLTPFFVWGGRGGARELWGIGDGGRRPVRRWRGVLAVGF